MGALGRLSGGCAALLALVALACRPAETGEGEPGAGPVPSSTEGAEAAGDRSPPVRPRPIPGTEIAVVVPADWGRADGTPGLWSSDRASVLRALEEPRSLEEVLADWNDPAWLEERDTVVLERGESSSDGRRTVRLRAQQVFGGELYRRWVALLADGSGCATVSVTCAEADAAAREAGIEAILDSLRWLRGREAEPFLGRDHRYEPPDGMEARRPFRTEVAFADAGRPYDPHAGSPLWLCGTRELDEPARDRAAREDLARALLRDTGVLVGVDVQRAEEVSIDGLPGVELRARARTKRGDVGVELHVQVLLDGPRALWAIGLVAADDPLAGAWVERFASAARTLRRGAPGR